jgi:hypothetical protein
MSCLVFGYRRFALAFRVKYLIVIDCWLYHFVKALSVNSAPSSAQICWGLPLSQMICSSISLTFYQLPNSRNKQRAIALYNRPQLSAPEAFCRQPRQHSWSHAITVVYYNLLFEWTFYLGRHRTLMSSFTTQFQRKHTSSPRLPAQRVPGLG